MPFLGVYGERGVYGAPADEQSESDIWAFTAQSLISFNGIKHSSDSIALSHSAQIDLAANKAAQGEINLAINAALAADGTKQSSDNIQINATGDISLSGIKHSSGTMQITAYAVIDWLGSTDVNRTGTFTIASVAGIAFGGIKHAADEVNTVLSGVVDVHGVKAAPGALSVTQITGVSFDGQKAAADAWSLGALASVAWSGFTSNTPAHSIIIRLQGVLQTTNIKGYI
jgi:hypothetical protein